MRKIQHSTGTYFLKNAVTEQEFNTLEECIDVFTEDNKYVGYSLGYVDLDEATEEELINIINENRLDLHRPKQRAIRATHKK